MVAPRRVGKRDRESCQGIINSNKKGGFTVDPHRGGGVRPLTLACHVMTRIYLSEMDNLGLQYENHGRA